MIRIDHIKASDNEALALVIRTVLKEFGVDKPGTVYTDPTTDQLFELFQQEGACYFVAKEGGNIIGGCGVFPTEGLPEGCAELVKLYLHKDFRKRGLGKDLMQRSIVAAKEMGYAQLYLETLPELQNAIALYEKMGFKKIEQALGNSGHFACNLWMLMQLKS